MNYKLIIFKSNKHFYLQIIDLDTKYIVFNKSTVSNKFKKKYKKLTMSEKAKLLIKKVIIFLNIKKKKNIIINYKKNKYLGINKIIFNLLKINNIQI
ncbi:MAG: 50S ribosomal protein L18 [Candidatus Shikimatogenerans sp. AspAUS03]|uniref:50S ribosomal protein L18 n=1 Tax=Candidatus Shikimatogenerans sp. AspAUS03 TaxID=3158563 RepID=A0AAU7QS89_9FLAO